MCGTVTGNCGWFCSLPSCRLYLQIVIWHHFSLDGNALLGLAVCEFLIAQELRVVSMCGILTLLEKWQMKHFQMRSKKCTTYLISILLSCSVGMRSHFDVNLSFIASKLYSVSSCFWRHLWFMERRRDGFVCLGREEKRYVVWFYSFSPTLFCQFCWNALINETFDICICVLL